MKDLYEANGIEAALRKIVDLSSSRLWLVISHQSMVPARTSELCETVYRLI